MQTPKITAIQLYFIKVQIKLVALGTFDTFEKLKIRFIKPSNRITTHREACMHSWRSLGVLLS